MSTTAQPAGLDPLALRADFPILNTMVHGDRPLVFLDNAASTQHPQQVIQSLVDMYEKHYANVHRGIHWLSEQSTDFYEQAREKVRAFVNSPRAEQIIFTPGTTASINTVARSWGDTNVKSGDEIILSVMEHHSNLVPWQQLAARTGAKLRHIPITDDGLLDLDAYAKLLNERTRLVAVTSVSNVLGTINPIQPIIAMAHQAGALVLIDAAQHAPHLPLDVQTLDCDFLAFSGHKMLGPSGVGVLYGREAILESMPPFLGGGSMISSVELDTFSPAELPAKFEAGTPPIVPAVALGTAIDYLTAVGLQRIHAHEQMLTRYAHDLLDGIAGVKIFGPAVEQKAGIVTFTVDGIHAHDVAHLVDRHGVAVRAGHHCTQPLHERLGVSATSRASFYLYNTLAEVDELGDAIIAAQQVFKRR
jgi:cysteine desulfurase/selenocysteine lyase